MKNTKVNIGEVYVQITSKLFISRSEIIMKNLYKIRNNLGASTV